MNGRPKIILVEDDNCSASFTLSALSSEYDVLHVKTGLAALDLIQNDLPDLVLLDVNMPGMSGYEVCRILRDNDDIGLLPVIFLSGMDKDEERLAGYEAGGDDYLTKPVSIDELRSKIKLQLAIQSERSRLKADITNTCSTATTAISGTTDIDVALQFLRTCLTCSTYTELCHETIKTLDAYGLRANVQIHGQQGVISVGANDSCLPLEKSVLTDMSHHNRPFGFSSNTSCSCDHITISVANEDISNHGRMKDNLAIIAEGANAHILALDKCITLTEQHATLSQLTANTRQALQRIEWRHREHEIKSNQLFQELQERFHAFMPSIGITDSQKEKLAQIFLTAANKASVLFNEGLETGAHLNDILKQLESAENLPNTRCPA